MWICMKITSHCSMARKAGWSSSGNDFHRTGGEVYISRTRAADYLAGVRLAAAQHMICHYSKRTGYLPDYDALDQGELNNARLMYLIIHPILWEQSQPGNFSKRRLNGFKNTPDCGSSMILPHAAFHYGTKHPSTFPWPGAGMCNRSLFTVES